MKRTIVLALVGLLAAGCALFAWLRGGHSTAGAAAPEARLRFAFDWPRGTTYRYAFTLRAESEVKLPLTDRSGGRQTLGGRANLAGELVLSSFGRSGDRYRIAARIDRLASGSIEMLGQRVFSSEAAAREALVGRDAIAEVDGYGRVTAVYFEPDAPAIFEHTMEGLLEQAQVVVMANGEHAWSVAELTPLGRGDARYEVEASDPARLVRTRAAYGSILALPGRALRPGDQDEEARATIALDARGFVSSIADEESLRVKRSDGAPGEDLVATSRFTLDLIEVGAFVPVDRDLASLDVHRPGELTGPADAERQILEQRAAGLTPEAMRTQLLAFGLTGTFPAKDWLLRASALLRMHPELCMDVAAVFEDPAMTDRGRAQIAQLLGGTGTPEAQAALRATLESAPARANGPLRRAAIQSFLVVSHPTRESLAFLSDALADAKPGDDAHAVALALGAAAGSALRNGDAALARAHAATLERALRDAKGPEDRRWLLRALGNVGAGDEVAAIAAYGRDDDADVRASAAFALRKIDSDDARRALESFVADPSPDVERNAFDALGYQALGADDLARLSQTVTAGATSQRSDAALVTLLAVHVKDGAPVRAMLQFLLARNGADNTMLAQIRHLLAAT